MKYIFAKQLIDKKFKFSHVSFQQQHNEANDIVNSRSTYIFCQLRQAEFRVCPKALKNHMSDIAYASLAPAFPISPIPGQNLIQMPLPSSIHWEKL
jgi:hypothetical protein